MAGNHPDVPAPRIAYDRDGTVVAEMDAVGTLAMPFDSITKAIFNNEAEDGVAVSTNPYILVLFPELRDLVGIFCQGRADGWTEDEAWKVEASSDTVTGGDGTWTEISPLTAGGSSTYPRYISNIKSVVAPAIKAIRISNGNPAKTHLFRAIHLYGNITAGQSPNRLTIWHPTLDQEVGGAYFDWGNAAQGSVATRQFRVKNLSATQTANAITCSKEVLTDTNPTVLAQQELSSDGAVFTNTISAGTLAPGALSSVLTLRRSIQANATLGLWAFRINASATSWV